VTTNPGQATTNNTDKLKFAYRFYGKFGNTTVAGDISSYNEFYPCFSGGIEFILEDISG
jgi:hypothetical protein